jgi:Cd2+/Zn2+-exporting ATPase
MLNTDPSHRHSYDQQGNMTCCSRTEAVYRNTGDGPEVHTSGEPGGHTHAHSPATGLRPYLPALISLTGLLAGLGLDHWLQPSFFREPVRLAWYLLAYLPVAWPVIKDAVRTMRRGEIFSEFFLMSLATVGAFVIGEYPEGVAVMLFYAIGELFQSAAVNRAKRNIQALLDIRPDSVTVLRHQPLRMKPEDIEIGEIIQVRAGEKVALDGELLSGESAFNTSALTGESRPLDVLRGGEVLAGMINLGPVIEIRVSKRFSDSSLARILDLVQHANSRKAQTELFIRRFSKVYTPVVVGLALCLLFLPWFFTDNYVFSEWLYRSLIFLVISCPCALVISIPLGYFGGIGAASRNGILFKGSNYLDQMTRVNTIVMDKTGTLTRGVFRVQQVESPLLPAEELLALVAAAESQSGHPIARAIVDHAGHGKIPLASETEEIAGHGLKAVVNGKQVLAGNTRLLKKFNIPYPAQLDTIPDTIVVAAVNQAYAGFITIADEIKADAPEAIRQMQSLQIETVMLSGDKQPVVDQVAASLGISRAFGNLLPEHKVEKLEALKKDRGRVIAFVGDGINDAPVLALSDVGIAMGGLGSDAAIETADVVIQTDQPSRIITAIRIGKQTRNIVWQNIGLAFGIKVIVLALGAGGLATMWEAVFADVGVALLAILNAIRIQNKTFVS